MESAAVFGCVGVLRVLVSVVDDVELSERAWAFCSMKIFLMEERACHIVVPSLPVLDERAVVVPGTLPVYALFCQQDTAL